MAGDGTTKKGAPAVHLEFRPLIHDDAAAYLAMMSDPDIIRFAATVPKAPDIGWAAARIKTRNYGPDPRGPQEFGMFKVSGEKRELVASALWFDASDGNTEVGYAVHKDHRGEGLAKLGLRHIMAHVRRKIGYTGRIYAGVAKDNLASMHIIESANFVKGWDWESESVGRGGAVQLWVYYFD